MKRTIPPLLAITLAACSGPQSMLEPVSDPARAIETMWWVLLAICTLVFLVVMAALLVAIFRRHRADAADPDVSERRTVVAVLVAGAGVPLVILVGIFVYTMVVLDEVAPSEPAGDVTIVVTGKQYWWDVRYILPGGETVLTANEIHIPVGQRVTLLLESDDVIHSLWVPKLHGKTDMIPGRTNEAWLIADEPGVYRGQCAEYCGVQHTWMAFHVIAHPEDEFRAWLARTRRPAAPVPPAQVTSAARPTPPDGGLEPAQDTALEPLDEPGPDVPDSLLRAGLARNARIREGLAVFLDPEHRCADCHTIRGVTDGPGGRAGIDAPGEPPGMTAEGPDLTHVASRLTLGAGLLPMSRGAMGGWISNPQVLKPGNLMPRIPLEPAEMNALLDYLMSLQ